MLIQGLLNFKKQLLSIVNEDCLHVEQCKLSATNGFIKTSSKQVNKL